MNGLASARISKVVAALAFVACAPAAQGVIIPITFSSGPITSTQISAGDPLGDALIRAGLQSLVTPPPSISGILTYSTSVTDTNSNPNVGLWNGAVDTLHVQVGSWISQWLTNVANNGDITVRNNTGTGNNVIDSITVTVAGIGSQNAGRFAYSFLDPGTNLGSTADDVTWALDQFTLTLTDNPPGAGLPTTLSSDALPTQAQWEANTWTARQVQLRFNPAPNVVSNQLAPATITFLAEVPEPGTLALLGLGCLAALAIGRRRERVL